MYVLCGWNDSGLLIRIERLDAGALIASWFPSFLKLEWELLNINNQAALTSRAYPLMAPISDTKILIFGGYDGSHAKQDGYVLDCEQMRID